MTDGLWRCLLPDWVQPPVRLGELILAGQWMFEVCQNQLWTAWPDGLGF